MANFQQSFNEECRRLSRKEVKAFVAPMAKTISELRHQVVELRNQVKSLQARIDKSCPVEVKAAPAAAAEANKDQSFRLTPERIRKVREKIGLSCPQFAKLLGVNYLSALNWEHGKTKPRQEQLQKIARIRDAGKRELKAEFAAKGMTFGKAKKTAKKQKAVSAPAPVPAPAEDKPAAN